VAHVKRVADRLRAALATPGAWVLLIACALLLLMSATASRQQTGTALEARIARTLSAMEGAGRVEVVIRTRESASQGKSGLLMTGGETELAPCGAVAVAEGADDPLVRMRLTQALCALLGLQASAVSVVSASGGGAQ